MTQRAPAEMVPLAPFTTLGLGGPARYLLAVRSAPALASALGWAEDRHLPVQVLGGGSNTIFADAGFAGLVVRMARRGFTFRPAGDAVLAVVQAGTEWDDFVRAAVERGLQGVECLSGIPGSAGATPVQNVGAYGQEVAQTLQWLRAYDRRLGRIVRIDGAECHFGYRTSRFKAGPDRGRFVILGIALRLVPGGAPELGYREVAERAAAKGVAGMGPTQALGAVRDIVLALRRGKSMLRDPEDPDARSVGSFFLNPVLDRRGVERLRLRLGERAAALPLFPDPGGGGKVSAAWLIEAAGFRRGDRKGGVGISQRHTLALVNRAGTAQELLAFADEIRTRVAERFGVRLEAEPVVVPAQGSEAPPW